MPSPPRSPILNRTPHPKLSVPHLLEDANSVLEEDVESGSGRDPRFLVDPATWSAARRLAQFVTSLDFGDEHRRRPVAAQEEFDRLTGNESGNESGNEPPRGPRGGLGRREG